MHPNSKRGGADVEGVPGLKLKWTPNDDAVIENLYNFECTGPEDAMHLFWKGLKNKMMASHRLNNASSRSHCILTFMVHQFDINSPDTSIISSKLQLVDLAGSERCIYERSWYDTRPTHFEGGHRN